MNENEKKNALFVGVIRTIGFKKCKSRRRF